MNNTFKISQDAARRIVELTKEDNLEGTGFRISVLGGGCSGFQYEFNHTAHQEDGDHIFCEGDATVYIDDTSLEFLKDCTLEYSEDLGGARFEIKNPNATAKCGCGNSFAV
jgi:iron-sulfur cluster insertion protein